MKLKFALLNLVAIAASASTITYTAAGTSSGGDSVDASATFTTSAGQLLITLNNLFQNPTDVAQNISDLSFTLDVGGLATLMSSTGTPITVNSGGSYTVGSSVSTGWALSSLPGDTFELNVLGTSVGPAHLIIGTSNAGNYTSGTFSNANGSIAGNTPHNPFLESGATFTISDTAITSATTVNGATFSFGTTAGDVLAGTCTAGDCGGGGTVSSVPEPVSFVLMGAGLIALSLIRRKRTA